MYALNFSFSSCQVYGPHTAALYTRSASLKKSLSALSHHFLKVDSISYKLQPGGPGYELVYGCTAIPPYLKSLSHSNTIQGGYEAITEHEQSLVALLLKYLKSKEDRGVRIVGEESTSRSRVPTISFVVVGERALRSRDIVKVFDSKGTVSDIDRPSSLVLPSVGVGVIVVLTAYFLLIPINVDVLLFACAILSPQIGIRYGHFYAFTLVDHLQPKIDVDDAVVRISLVHYNTVKEVERIIEIMEEALA